MKKNKTGFTIAELLVVVAIIGVLVAVSIPIFTAQLAKTRLATNQANIRAAKAAASADYLEYENGKYAAYVYDNQTGTLLVLLENYVGSFEIDPKHTTSVIFNDTSNESGRASAAKAIFARIYNRYYKDLFAQGSVSKCIVVYLSPNGIKTCPYYDSTKGIMTDMAN